MHENLLGFRYIFPTDLMNPRWRNDQTFEFLEKMQTQDYG